MVAQIERPVATPTRNERINPTGREVILTVPAKDGATYLGDMPVTLGADDSIRFPGDRALQLLSERLAPDTLATLRASFGQGRLVTPADFAPSGIVVTYDPQRIELVFEIPVERRASRSVAIAAYDRERVGEVILPNRFTTYLNIRGSVDIVEDGFDTGIQNPIFLVDGAVRHGDIVLESDGIIAPGARGPDFQRLGSRAVYDDTDALIRWSVGDLETTGRGFQGIPDIAGISLFRSYSVLNPQQIIRPRGDRTFRLERPSTVEVLVNGQQVRRLQLDPGNYDLRNFPFAQGSNDVQLNVLDDSGRSEVLRFNIFLDQTQLATGLSEFGLYAGVYAPLAAYGPDYSDELVASGFYRKGLSDYVTVGGNFQVDENTAMIGAESIFATSFGTVGLQVAGSTSDQFGEGYAIQATFQRLIQNGNGTSDTLNLYVERRSADFTPVSFFLPVNPYEFEVGAGYSHAFSERFYAGANLRYAQGRGTQDDLVSLRLNGGYRITDRATFSFEARYNEDFFGDEFSVFGALTIRLGSFSSVRTEYDTRNDRARLSYQTLQGSGVGSYNISADVERSDFGSGVNVNANYFTNRAELGFSHYGVFDGTFGASASQRTTLRFGTSIAATEGQVGIGRPIYDSFALIEPHPSLGDSTIVVDPTPFGYAAETGALKVATMPGLASYAERTITLEAENAPPGADIGQGSFRVLPFYRSGFYLPVGSDYNVTAIGTMIGVDGEPVALVSGTATELGKPDGETVTVFTNRQGRFGATGLAPGRWRIEMLDDDRSAFELDIPEDATGILRVGEITPIGE